MTTPYRFTMDLLFKKLLGSPGNEDILEKTVALITNQHFTNMHPIQQYNIHSYKKELDQRGSRELRATIVDIAATSEEGVDVVIEMQMHSHHALNERFLFYLCNKYVDNYPAKEDQRPGTNPYQSLKPVIMIAFCNFKLPHTELMHDVARFQSVRTTNSWHDRRGRPLLEAHTFSLVSTELTEEDSPDLLELQTLYRDGIITAKAPKFMKKSLRILERENMTEEEIELINREELAIYDQWAVQAEIRDQALEEGVEIGIRQGIKQESDQKQAMLLKAFAKAMSVEQLAQYAHLSVDEVKQIIGDEPLTSLDHKLP